MNKEEFLNTLDRKLQVINASERKDIIDEYRSHIEMKIKDGKTEEEAIEDFGDIDELVDDILDAYKINTDRVHNTFDAKLNTFFDQLFEGFKRFLGSFTSIEVDDVVKLVFEILIILILLAILQIPFRLVASLGASLLHSIIGFGIGSFLATLWRIIIGIAYVAVFIVVFVNLCSKRIKHYRQDKEDWQGETVFDDFKNSFDFESAKQTVHQFTSGKAKEQNTTTASSEEGEAEDSDDTNATEDTKDATHKEENKYHHRYSYTYTAKHKEEDSTTYPVTNGFLKVVFALMRIFFCLLMIPFVLMVIGLCCALGAMIVISFKGFTLPGAYLLVIGGLLVVNAFMSLLYKVLWRRG